MTGQGGSGLLLLVVVTCRASLRLTVGTRRTLCKNVAPDLALVAGYAGSTICGDDKVLVEILNDMFNEATSMGAIAIISDATRVTRS